MTFFNKKQTRHWNEAVSLASAVYVVERIEEEEFIFRTKTKHKDE